uniref:START domain-containing protein n=1 Tax=Euplotes harpa TaxID=151035 RepID=A0A7S3JFM7_9SPIT|mmetsp:Transcript_37978/g.43611  ORF Transcript_37978/g.43611 Transcript_37978/m.43611 type:complete len:225 (+) Transcript_37978:2-676(+)
MEPNYVSDILAYEPTLEDANGDDATLEFLKQLKTSHELFFTLKNSDDWTLSKDAQEVQLYTKPSGDPIDFIKRTMEVNASKEKVIPYFVDSEKFKEVDENCSGYEVIDEINDNSAFVKIEYKDSFLISGREYATIRQIFHLGDGSFFINHCSIENESIFPSNDKVRGYCKIVGTHIEPISDSKCKVSGYVLVDPKGSIPSTLVNMLIVLQHDIFVNIKTKAESE